MSKVTSWIVVIASVLLALAVTLPSVQPIDLLAGLGFFSVAVAVGFAFQDILENNPRRCTERSIDAVVADLPIGFASTAKSVRTLLGAIAGVKIS